MTRITDDPRPIVAPAVEFEVAADARCGTPVALTHGTGASTIIGCKSDVARVRCPGVESRAVVRAATTGILAGALIEPGRLLPPIAAHFSAGFANSRGLRSYAEDVQFLISHDLRRIGTPDLDTDAILNRIQRVLQDE